MLYLEESFTFYIRRRASIRCPLFVAFPVPFLHLLARRFEPRYSVLQRSKASSLNIFLAYFLFYISLLSSTSCYLRTPELRLMKRGKNYGVNHNYACKMTEWVFLFTCNLDLTAQFLWCSPRRKL